MTTDRSERRLTGLVDELVVRDAAAHAAAIEELAAVGDERVIPHLIDVATIHAIASDWGRFGFPEALRERAPPRYLELPEARWPGAFDALDALAEPTFDSPYAWVEWESWYSQQRIEPLAGFDAWKLRLYRSFLPPVGGLLDAEPRSFDLRDVRWGNCDRSFLAALNAPTFLPGKAVAVEGDGDATEDGSDDGGATDARPSDCESVDPGSTELADVETSAPLRYLADGDHVFGFEVDGTAYAVPRQVLFPHELLNADVGGVPVSLTFCTLCNAPILYDRRVDGRTLAFGSTGMLIEGNKVMFDEETESLWSQHRGVPIAGEHLAADDARRLDVRPVTQTTWGAWRSRHPDTRALAWETGYDYDYEAYDGNLGIFRHYWENESVVQPGVRTADDRLPEKTAVYGVTADDPGEVHVYPVEAVTERWPVVDELDGRAVVVLRDPTGDVAVYEAPSLPVTRKGDGLLDADGTQWRQTRDALEADGGRTLDRVPGRHGLWFAFRIGYDRAVVVDGTE